MKESKFPLICGHLSIDLVNTELVRRGNRLDLLPTETDIYDWLYAVQTQIPFWTNFSQDIEQHLPAIKKSLISMRNELRLHFESIAEQHIIPTSLIHYLETFIEQAPFTYKLQNGQLTRIPLGTLPSMLQAIIAFDALTLIANGQMQLLKRCANSDCVLLFIDEGGRRKWCSMKICGNRKKVAQFQQRKTEELP